MIGDSRRLKGDTETRGEWKKSKRKGEERAGRKKHVRARRERGVGKGLQGE